MEGLATLEEVAQQIKNSSKNIKLLYAFNGTGKTRLSLEFKELIQPKNEQEEIERKKILYYNAYTEDLFSWENDLEQYSRHALKINPMSTWLRNIVAVEGKGPRIIEKFQEYVLEERQNSSEKIEAQFNDEVTEVVFRTTYQGHTTEGVKISRGEESNFIWSIFYVLLESIIEERSLSEEERSTAAYNDLEYIFIDDPISSLDDRRIIDVAIDIANLVTKSNTNGTGLKFVMTTHHALYYNALFNELKYKSDKFILSKKEGKYYLKESRSDSPFAYHLLVKEKLERAIRDELDAAISEDRLEKYHFTLLRNLLEKTATFLGYDNWDKCVIVRNEQGELEDRKPYVRLINLHSHSSHSEYEARELKPNEKKTIILLFQEFMKEFHFTTLESDQ